MPQPVKVLITFGTRPEAIKLAPVIRALEDHPGFQVRVCVTAQHREMLDQVLGLFHIQPHHDLDLMRPDQSLSDLTARAVTGLESVLREEGPDIVLVQGDTTTVLAAALATYYRRTMLGHVEAGLRTHDKYSPFPEEMNRKVVDAVADLCFAATDWARRNLLQEGVSDERIFVTGNTVIDALQLIREEQASPAAQKQFEELFARRYAVPMDRRVILVTGHRRESFGLELESMCRGVRRLAQQNEDVRIVYPVHHNPNVQAPVHRILEGVDRVHLIQPLEYASFVWLMGRCHFVLTDSGGVQEEAPSLGKPVLVMRKKTERPEGIEAGVARLVGIDEESIFGEAQRLLQDQEAYAQMARSVNPYGDGKAAQRIVGILESHLLEAPPRAKRPGKREAIPKTLTPSVLLSRVPEKGKKFESGEFSKPPAEGGFVPSALPRGEFQDSLVKAPMSEVLRLGRRAGWYKRPFDLMVILGAHLFPPLIPVWTLLWLLIPLAIWLEDRGEIFYRQQRVGKNGRVFTIRKFRTMVPDAESLTGPVWATNNDPRITRVGRWLRLTAMDELPQLLNIWKGEMSFVGPRAERPELHAQFAKEIAEFPNRLQVRPGLTGLAQVKGAYNLQPAEKLRYDLEYIEKMGLWLDIKLMLSSVANTLLTKWDRPEHDPAMEK